MRVAVNGVKLFFDVDGMSLVPDGAELIRRPTLLVIHGGPGMDHSLLKPAFAPLSELAQVIWLDLRGHGRSDEVDAAGWTLQQCAEDIAGFCERVELDLPVLAGASVGGAAAALAAARHPDLFAGAILTSTPVGLRLAEMLDAFERLAGADVREQAERYWQDVASTEHAAAYRRTCLPLYSREPLNPAVMARAILRPEIASAFYAGPEWQALDLCKLAPLIRCPTLVISGADDPVAPVAAARELVRALPSGLGELLEIDGARHVLFEDAPAELQAAATRFLGRLPRRTAASGTT
jgi:pimeloyl-ACP methyl ester carboxylesterase